MTGAGPPEAPRPGTAALHEPVIAEEGAYRLLFEANPAPMWVYDLDTLRFMAVNDAAVAHYGYGREEFLDMTVGDLCPPEEVGELLVEVVGSAGSGGHRLRRHRRKDGSIVDAEVTRSNVVFRGRRARLIVARDVTTELHLAQALREREEALRETEGLTRLGRWEWDMDDNRVRWSDELYTIYGLRPQEMPATYEAYLARVHPDDRDIARGAVETSLQTGEPFTADYRIVLPDGEVRWLHSRGRLVGDGSGRPVRMVGVCQDITSRKAIEEELTRLALQDVLTGLPNRAVFMDRLTMALRRRERDQGRVAVMFIDLDRFKAVNDSMGHAVGDRLLVAAASRLRQVMRPEDTVARLSGDEFAVLCERLRGDGDELEIAGRIQAALGQPVTIEGQEVISSASIGIALSGEPDATADSLLRDADTAMYQAKEAGRNRAQVFDPVIRARNLERLRRSEELHRALEGGQFAVLYQPEVSLADESLTGVEALVRWRHPVHGLLPPAEFIGLAEDTGLIVRLGEWVFNEACRAVANRTAMPGWESLGLSVNLSARQLGEPGLVGTVREALSETGLAPERLCLEITESVLMDDVESAVEALRGLKALGVRLAIDDFGTGYSSLSYLRRFPVDVVKLDRSFVTGLGVDPVATAIVAAAVNLSHALGLSVVAEGVETEEQLVALRALRCDRAQGFYWSPAIPYDQLPAAGGARLASSDAPGPIDLQSLLVERTNALASATGRPVVLQAPPSLAAAYGQSPAVASVLDHLLSNALKYSPPDRPVVVSAAADRRWVRVSVADFGVGMTAAEASRCFEQFWQGSTVGGRRQQGIGIGLYIVRSLVEGMGGHVSVRAAPGRGSTFTFALPRSSRSVKGFVGALDVGEDSSIREFMRQLGVPLRRGS